MDSNSKLEITKLDDVQLEDGTVTIFSELDLVKDEKSGIFTAYTRYIAFAFGPSFSETADLLRTIMTKHDSSLILAHDTPTQQVFEYAFEIGSIKHKELHNEANRFMIWSNFHDDSNQAVVIKTAGDLRNAISGLSDDATIDILIAPEKAATMSEAVDALIYHLSYSNDNIYEDRAILSLDIYNTTRM